MIHGRVFVKKAAARCDPRKAGRKPEIARRREYQVKSWANGGWASLDCRSLCVRSVALALSEILDEYDKTVGAWQDQTKRTLSALQRLRKAVADGNLRDLEKLRQSARTAADGIREKAEACAALDFDTAAYLAPDGEFIPELKTAAERAGVRLFERDGTIFCYPVLVRLEPDLQAVRVDKRLEPTVRPGALAAILRRLQSREPKARPDAFIESLLKAYEIVRVQRGMEGWNDVPLTAIYQILTLLPGSDREYTLLDFARDVYFLDSSGVTRTRKGYAISFPASTVSRERSVKVIRFVTREGFEKDYAALKFSPPEEEEDRP
jgi:hypothetical protein